MSADWTEVQADPAFSRAMHDMLDIAAWLEMRRPDLTVMGYRWDPGSRPGTIAAVHVHRRGSDWPLHEEGCRLALEAVRALGWPPAGPRVLYKTVLLAADPPSAHLRLVAWGRIEAALRDRA